MKITKDDIVAFADTPEPPGPAAVPSDRLAGEADMYQRLSARTAISSIRDFTLQEKRMLNWALGVAGESGEIVDHVKKYIFHGAGLDHEHLKKELGDILWYVTQLATDLDIRLVGVMQANLDKLAARHPNGFTAESAQAKRDEQ